MSRPAALEKRLGHRFTRPRLLEQALTHGSWGPENNERLEFLGDGVLGCAVADELLERFPALTEGKLTQLRSRLVREETLAEIAGSLGLAGHLRLGVAQVRPSMLADALEAVFGAVFLDGGYPAARKAMMRVFGPALDRLDPLQEAKDAKTRLQEIVQARFKSTPRYRVTRSQGAAHEKMFDVECQVAELQLTAAGSGSSRQRAEQDAATAMLSQIGDA